MKYIDADKLIAEIERLYYNESEKDESILAADAYKNALDAVEKVIASLQQEQPSLPSNIDEAAEEYVEVSIHGFLAKDRNKKENFFRERPDRNRDVWWSRENPFPHGRCFNPYNKLELPHRDMFGDAVKWTYEPVECDIIFRIKKPCVPQSITRSGAGLRPAKIARFITQKRRKQNENQVTNKIPLDGFGAL